MYKSFFKFEKSICLVKVKFEIKLQNNPKLSFRAKQKFS